MNSTLNDEDVIAFAKHLGFSGLDADLFYESYYQLDNEEYETTAEECYEGAY